jgi:hypothetical protein
MERLGARDLPSVMLAERRLIFRGEVAMGTRFVRVKTTSLALSQGHHCRKRSDLSLNIQSAFETFKSATEWCELGTSPYLF